MEIKKQYDIDVILDVALFVTKGITPCGLSQRILHGDEVNSMKRFCHPLSRNILKNTKKIIDDLTLELFHGVDLADSKQIEEIRVLLTVSGKMNDCEYIVGGNHGTIS